MTKLVFPLILGLLIFSACGTKRQAWRDKPFDSLDDVERELMSWDSVYGDYEKWIGTNEDSVTWALYLDQPNKFAVKSFFDDSTGFFTKIPGNINSSGQWEDLGDKFRLKFYYPYYENYFDSVKNKLILKSVDAHTIELMKDAQTIWIMNTACKRIK